MKNIIIGKRFEEDNELLLSVDGKLLDSDMSQKVWNHSPDGFNAGYSGSGPAQSALAILLEVLKNADRASRLHQDFKREFLSNPEYLHNDFQFDVDILEWANLKELGF